MEQFRTVCMGWTLIQQPLAKKVHQISHLFSPSLCICFQNFPSLFITTTLPQLQTFLLLHWNNADTPNLFIGCPQLFRTMSCTSSPVILSEYLHLPNNCSAHTLIFYMNRNIIPIKKRLIKEKKKQIPELGPLKTPKCSTQISYIQTKNLRHCEASS